MRLYSLSGLRGDDAKHLMLLLFQEWQAQFCHQLVGFLLLVICSRHSIDMDKPLTVAQVTEIGTLQFIEQIPFNLEIKYKLFNVKGMPFNILYITFDPC